MEKGGIDMGMQKMFALGGENMDEQMEMFDSNIRLKDEGGEKDNVSGNDVPLGGDKEGVRDDQEANISVGEIVVPADVVRYHGVEKFMALRDEAKMGYKKMEAMGQLGNSEEAVLPDDTIFNPGGAPFSIVDMEVVDSDDDEVDAADGALIMAANGAVAAPTGNVSQVQTDPLTGQPIITTAEQEIAQESGELATGVTGQTAQNLQQQPVVAASPVTQAAVPAAQQSTQGTLPQFSNFFGSGSETFINQDGQQIVLPIGTPAPPGFRKKGESPENRVQPFPNSTPVESPEEKLARQRKEQAEEIRQNIDPTITSDNEAQSASSSLGNTDLTVDDFNNILDNSNVTIDQLGDQLASEVQVENALNAAKDSLLGQIASKSATGTALNLLGKFTKNIFGEGKTAKEKYDAYQEQFVAPRYGGQKGRGYQPTAEDIAATQAAAEEEQARLANPFERPGARGGQGASPQPDDIDTSPVTPEAQQSMDLAAAAVTAKGGLISAAKGTLTTNQKKLDVDGDGVLEGKDFAALRAGKKTNAMYGGLMKKKKKKKKSYVKGGLATPKK